MSVYLNCTICTYMCTYTIRPTVFLSSSSVGKCCCFILVTKLRSSSNSFCEIVVKLLAWSVLSCSAKLSCSNDADIHCEKYPWHALLTLASFQHDAHHFYFIHLRILNFPRIHSFHAFRKCIWNVFQVLSTVDLSFHWTRESLNTLAIFMTIYPIFIIELSVIISQGNSHKSVYMVITLKTVEIS